MHCGTNILETLEIQECQILEEEETEMEQEGLDKHSYIYRLLLCIRNMKYLTFTQN